jgi:hypothetical protein
MIRHLTTVASDLPLSNNNISITQCKQLRETPAAQQSDGWDTSPPLIGRPRWTRFDPCISLPLLLALSLTQTCTVVVRYVPHPPKRQKFPHFSPLLSPPSSRDPIHGRLPPPDLALKAAIAGSVPVLSSPLRAVASPVSYNVPRLLRPPVLSLFLAGAFIGS